MPTPMSISRQSAAVQMTVARSLDPIVAQEHAVTRCAVTTVQEAEKQAGDKRAMALQRKILALAAAALPPVTRVDTTAAKLKLARMLGIAVSEHDQDASDGR